MRVALTVSPGRLQAEPRELVQAEIVDGLDTKDVSRMEEVLIVLKSRDTPLPARLAVLTDWHARP